MSLEPETLQLLIENFDSLKLIVEQSNKNFNKDLKEIQNLTILKKQKKNLENENENIDYNETNLKRL
jgi:hypothetical protein